MTHPAQDRLGKYQVLEVVASGPVTEVYKARLDGIAGFSRLFAIKRVRAELSGHAELVAGLEARARAAADLSHGNVVQLLDLGRVDDRLHVVLEWVEGWSLTDVLARARAEDTPVPVAHVAWIGLQVLKALAYAHERSGDADGLHGAVCTDNVLIGRGGQVKLGDFGLARATDDLARAHPELAPVRTDRATPETLRGEPPSTSTDLFGVAVVLYTALTGHHPFPDADAITQGRFTPIAELRGGVPLSLVDLVTSALSPAPDQRPASATTMADVMQAVLHDEGDVFTQETLSSWVRTLFGEEVTSPGTRRRIVGELGDDLLEAAEDDTPVTEPTDPQPLPVHPTSAHPRIAEDDEEAKTAVGEVVPAASPKAGPAWEDSGATVVDEAMAAKLLEVQQGRASSEPTVIRAGMLDGLELPPPPPHPARLWFGGAGVALVVLLVGAVLGAAATALYGEQAGLQVNPPVLEVRATQLPGVQVQVDGADVSGPTTLTPGTHTVHVRWDDHPPLDTEVSLVHGEFRVMVVEPVQVPGDATTAADPSP